MTESAISQGPEMGPFARLVGVLFSPAKTFESIGRRPGTDWLLPVVLLLVLVFLGATLINPKLDTDTAYKEAVKRMESRQNLTDAQRDQAKTMMQRQFGAIKSGWVRFVIAPCFVIIPLLFVPAVYLGIAKAMGAAARYGTIFAGYAFCQVPQMIKGVIGLGVGASKDTIDLNEVEHIVRSNLGSFLNPDTTGKAFMAFANAIDLFELWGIVIGSIMLARTTKLSKNAATVTVVGLWIVYVLLKIGGAAIGAAFGG